MTPLNEDTVNAAMAKLRERIAELEAFDAASKVTIEKMALRINELTQDQISIAKVLNNYGIEHSGFAKQAPRVEMLAERAREHARQRIEEIKKRKLAEARSTELGALFAKAVAIVYQEASDRLVELDAVNTIQPESQPLGSHYEYVEGCKP